MTSFTSYKGSFDLYKEETLPLNNSRINEISGKINSELFPLLSEQLQNFSSDSRVITTTGSDGRLENIPESSNLEIIIYGEKIDPNLSKIVRSVFQTELNSINGVMIHPAEIEKHDLDKVNTLRYAEGGIMFPTRFLDNKFLGGNYEKYKQLWEQFIDELKKESKSSLKSFYSRINYHRKIVTTGQGTFQGNDIVYIVPDSREVKLYYKSGNASIFKMGVLRSYQYTLAKIIFQIIRNYELTDNDVSELRNMPKTIADKLDYTRDFIKGFNQEEKHYKEILDTYYYFLRLHNETKVIYSQQDTTIELSKEEFDILQDRLDFVAKEVSKWQIKLK